MTWLTQLFAGLAKPFKWWVIVAPWERGVRVRLGKTALLLEPGPHWRIPGVDRVYVQSVRLRTISETNQTLMTSDRQVVNLSYALLFAVADILKLYDSVANPELTLSMAAQAEIAKVVADTKSVDLTAALIADRVNGRLGELESWGLSQPECRIVGFAFVKTYRLISNDYRNFSGLSDLEKEHSGER